MFPRIICKRAWHSHTDGAHGRQRRKRDQVFVSIAKRHNGGSMLITDFRKGNAPGVGACLTLANASTYRKIKHARCITYPREKGIWERAREGEQG